MSGDTEKPAGSSRVSDPVFFGGVALAFVLVVAAAGVLILDIGGTSLAGSGESAPPVAENVYTQLHGGRWWMTGADDSHGDLGF